MAGNRLSDFATIVEDLDAMGRLIKVRSEVDPHLELAAIAARFEGGPRAVLFENVKGHDAPVLTGLYWSRELLADLMRRDEHTLPQFVSGCIKEWQSRADPPDDGRARPDLRGAVHQGRSAAHPPRRCTRSRTAVRTSTPAWSSPATPTPVCATRRSSDSWSSTSRPCTSTSSAGRHLELYLEKARARGESLAFSINCGVGPGLHFAAATPSEAAPADTDELGIACVFHDARLELVKGKKLPVHVVSNAMYALECEIVPGELGEEGPFAEVTGYYARRAPRPVVHVRAMHIRPNPVFQTILSGVEVWNSVGLLGEANVLGMLQRQVPGVRNVYFSHGGCGFYHAIVSIRQTRAGWSKQVIMAAFAAFPPLKMVTVVDDDVDIRDAKDVEWAMATRFDPANGILRIDNVFGHGLNPGFPDYLGTKVGFDACRPFPHTPEYDRAAYDKVDLAGHDIDVPEIRSGEGGAG